MFSCEILSGFRNLKGPESIFKPSKSHYKIHEYTSTMNLCNAKYFAAFDERSDSLSSVELNECAGTPVLPGSDYSFPVRCPIDSDVVYSFLKKDVIDIADFRLELGVSVFKRTIRKLDFVGNDALLALETNTYMETWYDRPSGSAVQFLRGEVESIEYRLDLYSTLLLSYEAEIERRAKLSQDSVDPQMFDMDSVFKSLKGHFSGLLDMLGQSFINNHQLVEMVFKAIIVFVLVKYVRRLTIPQVMVVIFVHTCD